MDRPTKREK
jgi:hypothetical protein